MDEQTKNRRRLLLVDGHNLLFQMFFGMPARIVNQDGKAIQGTLGFVGALIKIIKMTQPTHLLVLFDGEHENDRRALDGQYKANRPDYHEAAQEDNPFSQLPDVYAALDFMDVKHMECTEYEADDAIAGYAHRYGQENTVIIASFDSDYFQLISENVSVLRYRGEKSVLCDEAYLAQRFSIAPAQYAAFKSLTGDPADNIKGISGIGPKTAASLLHQFGDLYSLVEHCDDIKAPSIRKSVKESKERLMINHQLICLNRPLKTAYSLDELVFEYSGITTTQVLKGIGLK